MDALQGQAMAQEQHRRRHQEILCIGSALQHIADGEYGWCLKCGEAGAKARLISDPATPLCIDCAT
jgi:DnaK suppressor protein